MSNWDRIAATVASEFSDLSDLEQFVRACVRLLLAALLGALLGFERERAGKSAGLRTHMLVALGAALFVLVPLQAGADTADISRVVQGVVAGVGFLCAGTIIKAANSGDHVRGLTTSAGLWMTAAIGVAAGLGREMTAVLAALLAFAILALEEPLTRLTGKRPGD
ncbi:MAG TPA: MgtC/SapB family protein [Ramlibacter sp.]|nr:MgtC/SapB family protein [Ramlibacter sp.]